jgi:ribosomal protein S18 acetylase RimI-like enzyme
MQIRPATETDAATIAAIVAECDGVATPSEYELRKAREAVTSPTRRTVIAEVDGTPVGYASVELADPDRAHLSRLFVVPAHWGSGVAAALHAEALALAGSDEMSLFTPTDNPRARRFYEREGWQAAGTSRHAELGLELTEYRRALGSRRR